MRVLCLVDGVVTPPDRWLWSYLPALARADTVDFLSFMPSDRYRSWGKVFSYYPSYFRIARRALAQATTTDYDAIIAWESKFGFPLACLRRLSRTPRSKLVVLAFSYKGIARYVKPLAQLVMPAIDHCTVTASGEVPYYSTLLHLPAGKVSFTPLGGYDVGELEGGATIGGGPYAFAAGRSERDYRTLVDAFSGLRGRLVINARPFNLKGVSRPPNVEFNDFMPRRDFIAAMVGAQFVIVPLVDTPHAAGVGHLIYAMAAGKAIVATRTVGTVDYVEEGVTGLLVPPGDVGAMRRSVERLLNDPALATSMGREARRRYETRYTMKAFAERTYAVLSEIVSSS